MMRSSENIQADASLVQAKKKGVYFKRLLQGGHADHTGSGSIREAHHKGRHIVITTRYEVKIDGKPFHGDLSVGNGGEVHYHAIPTLGFPSAVDLVKCVIDVFPDDFPAGSPANGGEHSHHTGHATPRRKRTTRRRT